MRSIIVVMAACAAILSWAGCGKSETTAPKSTGPAPAKANPETPKPTPEAPAAGKPTPAPPAEKPGEAKAPKKSHYLELGVLEGCLAKSKLTEAERATKRAALLKALNVTPESFAAGKTAYAADEELKTQLADRTTPEMCRRELGAPEAAAAPTPPVARPARKAPAKPPLEARYLEVQVFTGCMALTKTADPDQARVKALMAQMEFTPETLAEAAKQFAADPKIVAALKSRVTLQACAREVAPR